MNAVMATAMPNPPSRLGHRRLTDFLGAAPLDSIPKGEMMASCHATLIADAYAVALQGCDKPPNILALLDRRLAESKAKAR